VSGSTRLDVLMAERGIAESRSRAQALIMAGRVLVEGAVVTKAGSPVPETARVELVAPPRYVSRGGEKLETALRAFAVDVTGERCLDVGASTGGFTDCLLQAGAEHVVAVDVGRGQLAWSVREDPRVTVLERTNVRTLEPDAIGGAVSLTVADLSFISLLTVAPALARCTETAGEWVLLVKPQFEAGRARIGKGGIVRDPEVHRAVLREVRDGLAGSGIVITAVIGSPLRGADGNVEFLVHCNRHGLLLADTEIDTVVARSWASEVPA
jgi:23S rRNA (cytidine1920-2'-O)/16S rRNA (cytidine1409-2'-O)-methyltransferase